MILKDAFAKTPPMGWNSWDCYGSAVTENDLIKNAEFVRDNLKDCGYQYIVCDIQWYQPTAEGKNYKSFAKLCMDEYSRLIPAENRFPSSSGGKGFKPIADRIHDMGLKFGIHIMRGIPRQAVHSGAVTKSGIKAKDIASFDSTCDWNNDMYGVDAGKKGAQEYYDSLIELYASWGVDFLKVDDIAYTEYASGGEFSGKGEIEIIRKAIDKSGRSIILSLSPGPSRLEDAFFLETNANMWRLTGDFWDKWDKLKEMFTVLERWYTHSKPGRYPDPDMIPFGMLNVNDKNEKRESRFTKEEKETLFSLWCISKSPLIIGADLPQTDSDTIKLLTNKNLISIDQHSEDNMPVYDDGSAVVWTCVDKNGNRVLAFFNISDGEIVIDDITKILPNINEITKNKTTAVDLLKYTKIETEMLWKKLKIAPHSTKILTICEQK